MLVNNKNKNNAEFNFADAFRVIFFLVEKSLAKINCLSACMSALADWSKNRIIQKVLLLHENLTKGK